jgi:rare lipoprotein A (peptidoglycan hydrolase)
MEAYDMLKEKQTAFQVRHLIAAGSLLAPWLAGFSPESVPADQGVDRRPGKPGFVQKGKASWYGPRFHGKTTANGETFNQNHLSAAHRSLPLGTTAEVTNLENGASVEVEINDRGPYVDGRVIDLSRAAARRLGMEKNGIALVRIEVDHATDAKQARRPQAKSDRKGDPT